MKDGLVEFEKGKPIKIGTWTYKVNWIIMY